MVNWPIELMDKFVKTTTSSSKSTQSTAIVSAQAPKTAQSLLITLPILAVVLFSIGYIELRTPETPAAQRVTKPAPTGVEATLPIATPDQQMLKPIPVDVTESLLNPTTAGIGDNRASLAAQPTVTSLQAPSSSVMTDNATVLQAHKHSQSFEQLLELL